MRCEELEAIVFSGREATQEERAAMQAHAKTREACRALMDSADVLGGARTMDEDVELPASFQQGWRSAVRRAPQKRSLRARLSGWQDGLFAGQMKRALAYACCAVALLGVGAQIGGRMSAEHALAGAPRTAQYNAQTAAYDGGMAYDGLAYDGEAAYGAAPKLRSAGAMAADAGRKIVYTAQLSLRTDRFDEAVDGVQQQALAAGGSVTRCEISGEKDGGRSAYIEMRVPPESLAPMMDGAGALGDVTREETASADYTDAYRDNDSRLESARAKKAQLDALYARAQDMEDVIALTNALFDVQQEIDALAGANRDIDQRASLAQLTVRVQERVGAARMPFGQSLARRAGEGLTAFGDALAGLLLGAAYALPWLLILAAAAGAILAARRKKRK